MQIFCMLQLISMNITVIFLDVKVLQLFGGEKKPHKPAKVSQWLRSPTNFIRFVKLFTDVWQEGP